jgi:hypothetical protein
MSVAGPATRGLYIISFLPLDRRLEIKKVLGLNPALL